HECRSALRHTRERAAHTHGGRGGIQRTLEGALQQNPFERRIVQHVARARSSSTTTAGRRLPSRNSKKAPPPVEMYEMRSATLNCSTAASVSPPPAIEKALLAATACVTARVPAANSGCSKTPSGPFHTIVPAPWSLAA